MATIIEEGSARPASPFRTTAFRLASGLSVAIAAVAVAGALGAAPAGASTAGTSAPDLAQRVIALARPQSARAGSVAAAPRIPGPPNISKVTTASGSATATTPAVATTTAGISATYTGTTLTVLWGPSNTLTVSGAGPLSAGSTVSSLNLGTGQTGTIAVTGATTCSAPGGRSALWEKLRRRQLAVS